MGKYIQKEVLANLYDVSPEYLVGWSDETAAPSFLDSKIIQIAQQIEKHQPLRALFEMTQTLSEDEIKVITQMICVLKKKQ